MNLLIDNRTEEHIALDEALPEAEGGFDAEFFALELSGVSNIFRAKNNTGYVFVTADGYIGTDSEGNAKNHLDAPIAGKLKGYLADIKGTRADEISIEGASELIYKAEKTDKGTYIFTVLAQGYGIRGEKYPSGEHIVIRLALSEAGKIICCMTVSEAETDGIGDACADYEFYSQYNGKDITTLEGVETISGATVTSGGYREAVKLALLTLGAVKGE